MRIGKVVGWLLALSLGGIAIFFVVAVLLAPDEGPRPVDDDAVAAFTSRYGKDAQILRVSISEDEVVARSFRVEYRKRASGESGKIEIQFMSVGDRKWGVSPALPKSLP